MNAHGGDQRSIVGVVQWHAERAWVGGRARRDVLLTTQGDRIMTVAHDVERPPGARRLSGLVLPGLANAHSHAFHRALRGRTEHIRGEFWRWRWEMYRLAAAMNPDILHAVALGVYAEMALAGITAVGEFHYLHHQPDGRPYDPPGAMADALVAAADEAGIRLTLLDTCYLRGGFSEPLYEVQRRFGDGDADAWAARASTLASRPTMRPAAAIHSVRAVDPEAMEVVRDWAASRGTPLHVHVSEQPEENEACLAMTGLTPTQLLAKAGVLGLRTTAVHATHLTDIDIQILGATRTTVCLCPTTERALADGVGPAAAMHSAGSPLALGSDSNAIIDLFEEARAVELDERLVTRLRGHHAPYALVDAATRNGMSALGWDAGTLAPGQLADFIAIDLGSPRLAGYEDTQAAAFVTFAATAADVTDVVVGGRPIVRGGVHRLGPVGPQLHEAIAEAWRLA